jgi:ankyrin repeat protein
MNCSPSEIIRHSQPVVACAIALLLSAAGLLAGASEAPLADATEKMDRTAIHALLEQRVDVNAPQVDGMTALHWAAYQDDLDTVGLLVRAGANVKAANRYGVTPLSLACTNGNAAIVDLLLKAGADVNAADDHGVTPLSQATENNDAPLVQRLLAAGEHVAAYRSDADWFDIGTVHEHERAVVDIEQFPEKYDLETPALERHDLFRTME